MRSSDDASTPPQRHPAFDAVSAVTCLLGEYDRSRLWLLAGWLAGRPAGWLAHVRWLPHCTQEAQGTKLPALAAAAAAVAGEGGHDLSAEQMHAAMFASLARVTISWLPVVLPCFTHRYQGEIGKSAPRSDCPPGTLRTQPCQPHTRSGTAGGVRCACRLPVCLTARACVHVLRGVVVWAVQVVHAVFASLRRRGAKEFLSTPRTFELFGAWRTAPVQAAVGAPDAIGRDPA
jgi:hypothetical protein